MLPRNPRDGQGHRMALDVSVVASNALLILLALTVASIIPINPVSKYFLAACDL